MSDPQASLSEVRRILKLGGRVQFASLPNVDSFAFEAFRSYWYNLECPRHLFHFSPTTLDAMLRKSGFEPEYIRPEKNTTELIHSVGYLFGKKPRLIHPIVWHVMSPLASLIQRFRKSGLMVAAARKV